MVVSETSYGDRIEVGVEKVVAGRVIVHRVRLGTSGVEALQRALDSVECREVQSNEKEVAS